MDFGLALKRIEALERELELLYDWFAESCEADPSVAAIFKSLAHEEHVHADIVSYQFRVFQKNQEKFGSVEIDTADISGLAERMREFRTARRNLTSEEALEVAYETENRAAEHYYLLAGVQSNPEMKGLLNAMASSCSQHHERLAQFFISTGLEVKTDKDFDIGTPNTDRP
jgi:rubrerythrin